MAPKMGFDVYCLVNNAKLQVIYIVLVMSECHSENLPLSGRGVGLARLGRVLRRLNRRARDLDPANEVQCC